jgi:hypothetical protein
MNATARGHCPALARRLIFPAATGAALRAFVREVVSAAARQRVCVAAARELARRAALDEVRREARAFDRLFEDARDLLRECAVLARGALLERALQFRGNVSADEDAFTVRHSRVLLSPLRLRKVP